MGFSPNSLGSLGTPLLRIGGVAALFVFLLKAFGSNVPSFVLDRAWTFGSIIGLVIHLIDTIFIYPFYRSPLRNLPRAKQRGFFDVSIIAERPRGKTPFTWFKQHPDADMIAMYGAFNDARLFPVSPDALRDIMSTNVYDFEKPYGARAFLARVIGYGLILSEGDAHKKQRKVLTPAFNIRNIRALYPLMWQKVNVLLQETAKEHKQRGAIDLAVWGSKLTLDIIGPAALSRDFNSMQSTDNRIADAFLQILEPDMSLVLFMVANFFLPQWLITRVPAKANRVINTHCTYLRDLCRSILDEKKEVYRTEKAHDENDIMTNIIASQQFSDDEIIDQMLTFLAAGHETTASALTWTGYLMTLNPDIQDKLRAEIRENIPSPDSGEEVTNETFERLPYLNGVAEEVLRLFPTVPSTIREAVRDTTVAGTPVPKGTALVIVMYAVNRNPRFWGPDAEKMVPERWIDIDEKGNARPNKHGGASSNFCEITFLHGNRACIGRDFAKAELRCAIAGMFGRYRVRMRNPDEKVEIAGTVTTKPPGGMNLILDAVPGW